MKKVIILQVVSILFSVCVSAQFKVNEYGNVGIKTDGNAQHSLVINALDAERGIFVDRTGPNRYGTNGFEAIKSRCLLYGTAISYGVHSICSAVSPLGSGRATGVLGFAGNSTNGYNFGILGIVKPSQYGAGVFGSDTEDWSGTYIDGRYAGYFKGNVKVTGTINAVNISSSDARYKQNIVRLGSSETGLRSNTPSILDNVMLLSPVEYNLKQTYFEPESDTTKLRAGIFNEESQMFQKTHFGLIAQELREIYPNLVYEEDNGYLAINYTGLIPILLQSIKELNQKVEQLEASSITLDKTIEPELALAKADNQEAVLHQNVPNPFTSSTKIEYYLPETVKTAYLCIYDMQGKQLKQIKLTERGQGVETIMGSQLAAGIYLYALIADGQEVGVKRMVLTE